MRNGTWWLAFGLFVALIVTVVGCSSGDDDDAGDDGAPTDDQSGDDDAADYVYDEPCADGPEFAYALHSDPMTVPYPNDLYTVADGAMPNGIRPAISAQTAGPVGMLASLGFTGFIVDAINALDGFSTLADLYLPVGAEPDEASFPDEQSASIGDSLVLMSTDGTDLIPISAQWKHDTLHLRPFRPMRQSTRYILAATRGLSPASGSCYRASGDMAQVVSSYRALVPGESVEKSGTGEQVDALAYLDQAGIAPENVLSFSMFTTVSATDGLNAAREVLDDLAESEGAEWSNWDVVEIDFEPVDHYAFADVKTPIFQDDAGLWQFDDAGRPIVQSWEQVQSLISLPTDPSMQPYPVVVYGHGLGDTKESLSDLDLAAAMADAGFALMGIDAVCHGPRGPIPSLPPMALLCYFDFFNPLRFRDNIRQTISDYMWFTRALEGLRDVDMIPPGGDGIPDFDVDHRYYLSISMGSIHGGILAGLEENIEAFAFSAAGAKFTGVAFEGPYLEELLVLARMIDEQMPQLGLEDKLWIYAGLMQNVLDAADPANFLPHVIDDPLPGLEGRVTQVLQQGFSEDYVIGGMSGAYFARAAGWPQFNPYVWDVGVEHADLPSTGSGFYQYDTDEHFNLWLTTPLGTAVRDQIFHFLRTKYETGTGEIIDPLAR